MTFLEMNLRYLLPPGQARVAIALLDGDPPRTYADVAERLGIHIGTVHRHLGRIRSQRPDVYHEIMAERRAQLGRWHVYVTERRRLRSLAWGRRRYAARFRAEHGRWPWEVAA